MTSIAIWFIQKACTLPSASSRPVLLQRSRRNMVTVSLRECSKMASDWLLGNGLLETSWWIVTQRWNNEYQYQDCNTVRKPIFSLCYDLMEVMGVNKGRELAAKKGEENCLMAQTVKWIRIRLKVRIHLAITNQRYLLDLVLEIDKYVPLKLKPTRSVESRHSFIYT